MKEVIWKNGQEGGTPISEEIWSFIQKLWHLGYIKTRQSINADFLNKYHIENLLDEYKNGKSIYEIGKIFLKEEKKC